MSSMAETALSFDEWTQVIDGTSATKGYIQNKTAGRGMIWRFGSSAPDATVWIGHALLPGHPILVELPTSENLYMRQTDSGAAVKVTATTI